jgi:hypothetical protein
MKVPHSVFLPTASPAFRESRSATVLRKACTFIRSPFDASLPITFLATPVNRPFLGPPATHSTSLADALTLAASTDH